jgi:hypothetical protein
MRRATGKGWMRVRRLGELVLVLGICAHLAFGFSTAYKRVRAARHGADYASYHYAVRVAFRGGDPYETRALERVARKEHTRKQVHPYLYPPPFLLSMLWSLPLGLARASLVMLALNELLLAGCVALCLRSFRVAPWAMGLLLACYRPIADNAWMGQANLIALFPLLLGFAIASRRPWVGGALVGAAAMMKMSPALCLLYWALQRRFQPIVAAVVAAIVLSLATLPLVGLQAQLRFYTEVLPGFSSGDYHGLRIPITLRANHSIPDIFNSLWPSGSKFRLSSLARIASTVATLSLLAVWAFRYRKPLTTDPDPNAIGALTVIMTLLPVYAYEHHLVFLLLAIGAALTTRPGLLALAAAFFVGWPLGWLRATQKALPFGDWLVQESKFIGALVIFTLNLLGPRKSPDRALKAFSVRAQRALAAIRSHLRNITSRPPWRRGSGRGPPVVADRPR